MISEIYGLVHTWLNEIFDANMSIKTWQYIYGSDIITSRSDVVDYMSEMISLGVLFAILILVILVFAGVFKLAFRVIKWY